VSPAATSFSTTVNGSSTSATITYGAQATLAESGLPAGATGTVTFTSATPSATLCTITDYPTNTSCTTSATLATGTYTGISATFSDTDGNHSGSTSTNTVSLTVAPPGVQNLVIVNGGSAKGKPETNDTITLTFNAALKVSTVCGAWSGDTTSHSISDLIVTLNKGTGSVDDSVTFSEPGGGTCGSTLNFGTKIDLSGVHGGAFTSGHTLPFTASTAAYGYNSSTGVSTIVITLGAPSNAAFESADTSSITATWSESGILSTLGSTLTPTSVNETAELF
jgi:hypothetical protein